jgi:hypothetical protein
MRELLMLMYIYCIITHNRCPPAPKLHTGYLSLFAVFLRASYLRSLGCPTTFSCHHQRAYATRHRQRAQACLIASARSMQSWWNTWPQRSRRRMSPFVYVVTQIEQAALSAVAMAVSWAVVNVCRAVTASMSRFGVNPSGASSGSRLLSSLEDSPAISTQACSNRDRSYRYSKSRSMSSPVRSIS